ncbi:Uncharacterised protein [Janthinobacterium lividum]|nr:Uncharacterised protein [Janthinobacterium lividum]
MTIFLGEFSIIVLKLPAIFYWTFSIICNFRGWVIFFYFFNFFCNAFVFFCHSAWYGFNF